jgi:hypothetical protein
MNALLNSLRLWSSSDGASANLTDDQLRREKDILEDKLGKLDSVRSHFERCDSLFIAILFPTLPSSMLHQASYKVCVHSDRATRPLKSRYDPSRSPSKMSWTTISTRSSQPQSKRPKHKQTSRSRNGRSHTTEMAKAGTIIPHTKLWCVVMESIRMLKAYTILTSS